MLTTGILQDKTGVECRVNMLYVIENLSMFGLVHDKGLYASNDSESINVWPGS